MTIPYLSAAVLTVATLAGPAAAHDPGLRITYRAASEHYCIRPHREDAMLTSGVRLYHTECRTRTKWARQGVGIEDRRQRLAAVDGPRG